MLRGVRGAADVFPDQIVGKGYVEIKIDRKKAARYGINVGDIQDVVEVAMGGRPVTMTVEGRERYPVRVRYARDYRDDVEALKGILVSARGMAADGQSGEMSGMGRQRRGRCHRRSPGQASSVHIPLAAVADIRVVEGPSMIKSENGMLRSYIQLRVRDRDEVGFVEERSARRRRQGREDPSGRDVHRMDGHVRAPGPGQQDAADRLPGGHRRDRADPLPDAQELDRCAADDDERLGRLAGGAIFQWLFGFNFSVAVQVGYIACFGMAVETGMVMLVYLREAIDERGGLERDRLDRRAAAGDPGGGDPPPAAQAADRRGGDHLDRPDALGHRRRGRGDPADGGAGAGRSFDRRRGDRRLPAGALLRCSETTLGEGEPCRRVGRHSWVKQRREHCAGNVFFTRGPMGLRSAGSQPGKGIQQGDCSLRGNSRVSRR